MSPPPPTSSSLLLISSLLLFPGLQELRILPGLERRSLTTRAQRRPVLASIQYGQDTLHVAITLIPSAGSAWLGFHPSVLASVKQASFTQPRPKRLYQLQAK